MKLLNLCFGAPLPLSLETNYKDIDIINITSEDKKRKLIEIIYNFKPGEEIEKARTFCNEIYKIKKDEIDGVVLGSLLESIVCPVQMIFKKLGYKVFYYHNFKLYKAQSI